MAIAAAIALALASACDNGPLPEAETLPEKPVEILVDDLGIAHVYAQSDRDAMWAAGYRMASDRLYQMEMLRRFAQGRLSEVLGEQGFERDRLARAFDLPRWGRADLEATRAADPERVMLVHAWVKGINARVKEIRSGAAPRPFGYRADQKDFLPEEWSEEDPYIVLKGAGLALDKTIEFEIALTLLERIYPDAMAAVDVLRPAENVFSVPTEDRPKELGPVGASGSSSSSAAPAKTKAPAVDRPFAGLARMLDAFPRASGSNNWAIDGSLTATGKPMIAGDPHLSFDFFGAPYPLHIDSKAAGGTFSVAGFAYPGTPGIALGHNDKVIWAATSAFGDVTDVWEVKKVGEGDRIAIAGKEVALALRTEKVVVRAPGAPAGQGRTEEIEYADVPGYGVLLPDGLVPIPVGGPYLVNWTGFRGRPMRWFMELNRVQSLDELERAVDRMKEMNYNFVAADASGIAYRVGVDVPMRAPITKTRRPWTVMPGGDAESFWSGAMLPPERHPHGRAGARHFIATANNDPFGITAGDVATAPFYYGAFFDPGFRASRITSELDRLATTKKGSIALDDMKALQLDTTSTIATELTTQLSASFAKVATDPALAEVKGDSGLERLVKVLGAEWDKRMTRDSKGALAFQALLHHVMMEVLKDDIPLGYDFALKLQTVFIAKVALEAVLGKYPNGDRILQGGRDLVLLRAAKKAAAFLVAKYGAVDAAPWSAKKATRFDHALGYGIPLFSVPTEGGEDTINVSQNIAFDTGDAPWTSSYVSVERTVGAIAADGVPEAFVTFPFASAADPDAPETKAANARYVEGKHEAIPFRRPDVERRAVRRETLRP